MWKEALNYAKQLITLTSKTQQHKEDIKALRQEMKEMREELRALAEAVREMKLEQQHEREIATRDREICGYG
ncbi:MAG TPA: hypothetical protein VFB21_23370 [Chthonomonadaceae bacterium]|nr:hypothetical protein [Chthonomonadaceae bacterium]